MGWETRGGGADLVGMRGREKLRIKHGRLGAKEGSGQKRMGRMRWGKESSVPSLAGLAGWCVAVPARVAAAALNVVNVYTSIDCGWHVSCSLSCSV